MTPFGGFICAVIAAVLLKQPHRTLLVTLPTWLAVLGFQTWGIASGRGVSPPATVHQASYWVVQVLIFAFTAGVATQLASALAARDRGFALSPHVRRQYARATVATVAGSGLFLYVAFFAFRSTFDPGSVVHHSTEGSPPIAGAIGILVLVGSCAGLAIGRFVRRRRPSRAAHAIG